MTDHSYFINLSKLIKKSTWLTIILQGSSEHAEMCEVSKVSTRNSSGDEIANVNFLYDDIVHVL